MSEPDPTFPPLLNGHGIAADQKPLEWALAQVASGSLSAGDLVWSNAQNQLHFALVLEPDVPRERCAEMVYVALDAIGDATGALIPPEVSITYQWPNIVQMNDGKIGSVDLIVSDDAADGVPAWMILSVDIQLTPNFAEMNPGEDYQNTTMWDEGCGEVTRTQLLESISRHVVNFIHTWSEEGFKPIHDQWRGRLNKQLPLAAGLSLGDGKFVGVDEIGNGLITSGNLTKSHPVIEALEELRMRSEPAP